MRPARAIALGALTVATLDICDAIIFFGLRSGVTAVRIFQSIASGLLGRAAYAGGTATAVLGAGLHLFIATGIVTTYYLVSRRLRFLTTRPWLYGPIYGLIVYAVMNAIVVPLSAAAHGFPKLPVLVNGLLIHIFGVGIPTAAFVQAASSQAAPR